MRESNTATLGWGASGAVAGRTRPRAPRAPGPKMRWLFSAQSASRPWGQGEGCTQFESRTTNRQETGARI